MRKITIKGINIKQFKKWILKEIGKKCKDYDFDCLICRSWKLFEEIEAYKNFIDMLDKMDIEKSEIRKHKE